jgi:hypothetical protein
MTTMAQARAADGRVAVGLLILYLDYCTNEYGEGACTASGGNCRFTWETCEDPTNFAKGTREYWFTNRGASYCYGPDGGALPYLRGNIEAAPTEIYPDQFQTQRGAMTFELDEDDAAPYSDPAKTTGVADSGRFWRNLLARNPNYPGRRAELYEGFEGVDSSLWELVWSGYIDDLDFISGGVSVACVDRLWQAAEAQSPASVSDTNTVQDDPLTAGATTVTVVDVTEFPTATANEPRVVKIEDEYIIYTGKGAATLTGCTRGAFGTTGAAHVKGTAITNALVYANDDAATWAACTGLDAAAILYDLLCNQAGVAAEFMATVDVGVTLNEALDTSETDIDLNAATALPATGVVKIGDEFILYSAVDADGITACKRGMFGTTAAAADDDAPVYLLSLSYELGRWRPGTTWGCRFDSETAVEELIAALARSVGFDCWQNESGLIETSIQAPVMNYETVTELTHEDMLTRSREYRRNDESRCTAVVVRYLAAVADPGDSAENYPGVAAYVGAEEENTNSYGKRRVKEIFCPFCRSFADAYWLAQRAMLRYREGMPVVDFAVEIKDGDIETGVALYLTIPERVDQDGAAIRRQYKVTRRERKGLNEVWYRAADAGYGTARFGLIAAALSTLDVAINDSETSLDVDLGTNRSIADYRADGGDIVIDDEQISYTTVADLGSNKIRLGGLTRGVGATDPAAHLIDSLILMLYTAASDAYRNKHVFTGDADGEVAAGVAGYKMA